mgnify:CR=1 FL=1
MLTEMEVKSSSEIVYFVHVAREQRREIVDFCFSSRGDITETQTVAAIRCDLSLQCAELLFEIVHIAFDVVANGLDNKTVNAFDDAPDTTGNKK